MKTILQVVSSLDPSLGGVSCGISESVQCLSAIGISSEIVCLDDPKASFLKSISFPVHALGLRKGPWQYNALLRPWLAENARNFDAIIVNGLWLYAGYAVYKTLRSIQGAPCYFVMPHGMLDPYFQKEKTRKFKAIRNYIYWNLLEKKVVNNAAGLFFTTQQELYESRLTFRGYCPKAEFNIGYGIADPPPIDNLKRKKFLSQFPMLHHKPYFLFLGRIHPKKGIDMLIEAYLRIKHNGIHLPLLVVAGPGMSSDYGKKIRQLAQKDPDSIIFPGLLTGDLKWAALDLCEAMILPSHQENFGIVVAESLASSRPVLISDKVNIASLILSSQAGLVDSDNVDGVMNLLLRWKSFNSAEKRSLGRAARDLYEKEFSMDVVASRIKQIIFHQ